MSKFEDKAKKLIANRKERQTECNFRCKNFR